MFLDSNQLECQLKLHRATQNNTTITTGEFYDEFLCVFLVFVPMQNVVVCIGRCHTHTSAFLTFIVFTFSKCILLLITKRSFCEFCAAADSGVDGSL